MEILKVLSLKTNFEATFIEKRWQAASLDKACREPRLRRQRKWQRNAKKQTYLQNTKFPSLKYLLIILLFYVQYHHDGRSISHWDSNKWFWCKNGEWNIYCYTGSKSQLPGYCFAEYVQGIPWNACHTCSTIICPCLLNLPNVLGWTNKIIPYSKCSTQLDTFGCRTLQNSIMKEFEPHLSVWRHCEQLCNNNILFFFFENHFARILR